MKDKILKKAAEKFLTLGVKNVTMDEIAADLGISKKTIYTHFSTKIKLIEATTYHVYENMEKGIKEIGNRDLNAIEEHYVIKDFALSCLKDENSSPQFQLQKYYPKIYSEINKKQKSLMENMLRKNLERGMKQGFYREDIPVNFLCRIYFIQMLGIKDRELFPETEFSTSQLVENQLEYHLRAIVTEKGLETLKSYIHNND
ncbi:TetR/AcrR family transcriptional regulator [Salinimicrobium sp. GXAS 041]|uniref:TetR/AcrR family transcriptional regulator n=1 Tax=Salinimicrobium sp. GXAS 041 TaxID=3400806 RepID=UPI003C7231DB